MTADRKVPTLTELPSDINGNSFAIRLQETIGEIWNLLGGRLLAIDGTANSITAEMAVPTSWTTFTDGQMYSFIALYNNTDVVEMTIGGVTVPIYDPDGNDLVADDILAGRLHRLEYNSDFGGLVLVSSGGTSANTTGILPKYSHFKILTGSGTWDLPHRAYVEAHAVGPSGSGAYGSGVTYRSSGSGAGGHSMKRALLDANTTFTYSVGTGGAAQTSNNNNGIAASGATTLSFSTFTLTASAGAPGVAVSGSTAAGGVGGAASGGDENWTGGDGGDSNGDRAPSGGGSVGFFEDGKDGGATSATLGAGGGGGTKTTPSVNVATGGLGYEFPVILGGLLFVGSGKGTNGTGAGFGGYGGGFVNDSEVTTTVRYGAGAPASYNPAPPAGCDGIVIIFYSDEVA